MDDMISRQTAIDAVENLVSSMSVCINVDEYNGMLARTKLDYATGSRRWCRKEKTMTAKEAISILELHNPFLGTDKNLTEAFDMAIKALTAQQWIPCSERLPKEEKKTYWVCTDTEYQCECRWTNNRFGIGEGEWGWSIFDTPQYSKPIAWMPLPEPWKGEQE